MPATTYIKRLPTEDRAVDWMRMKNRTDRTGNTFVLIDGPEDDFAVVDIRTAIEMDTLYRWEA